MRIAAATVAEMWTLYPNRTAGIFRFLPGFTACTITTKIWPQKQCLVFRTTLSDRMCTLLLLHRHLYPEPNLNPYTKFQASCSCRPSSSQLVGMDVDWGFHGSSKIYLSWEQQNICWPWANSCILYPTVHLAASQALRCWQKSISDEVWLCSAGLHAHCKHNLVTII